MHTDLHQCHFKLVAVWHKCCQPPATLPCTGRRGSGGGGQVTQVRSAPPLLGCLRSSAPPAAHTAQPDVRVVHPARVRARAAGPPRGQASTSRSSVEADTAEWPISRLARRGAWPPRPVPAPRPRFPKDGGSSPPGSGDYRGDSGSLSWHRDLQNRFITTRYAVGVKSSVLNSRQCRSACPCTGRGRG